jgi:hypothetical protein
VAISHANNASLSVPPNALTAAISPSPNKKRP